MPGRDLVLVVVKRNALKITIPIGSASIVTLSIDNLINGRHIASNLQKKRP